MKYKQTYLNPFARAYMTLKELAAYYVDNVEVQQYYLKDYCKWCGLTDTQYNTIRSYMVEFAKYKPLTIKGNYRKRYPYET